MIPFDEVSGETWDTLSLIMGESSLLSECLAVLASDEDSTPDDAAELGLVVQREIVRARGGLSTNSLAVTQLDSEQWQFIAEALVKVSDAFRLPGSFDWTDTTESAFSEDAT